MTARERERFHALLVMAKESPFAGERRNALAAATRMAERTGLSVEDAARSGGERYQAAPDARPAPSTFDDLAGTFRNGGFRTRTAQAFRSSEIRHAREKKRFEEALAAARARGLDSDGDRPAPQREQRSWYRNPRRRSPASHARVLLEETRLSLAEVASISGLDLWSVVGMKLRMREKPANPS